MCPDSVIWRPLLSPSYAICHFIFLNVSILHNRLIWTHEIETSSWCTIWQVKTGSRRGKSLSPRPVLGFELEENLWHQIINDKYVSHIFTPAGQFSHGNPGTWGRTSSCRRTLLRMNLEFRILMCGGPAFILYLLGGVFMTGWAADITICTSDWSVHGWSIRKRK